MEMVMKVFNLEYGLVRCLFKNISMFLFVLMLLANPQSANSKMNLSSYPTPEEMAALPYWAQIVLLTGPRTNPPEYLMKERLKLKEKYGSIPIDTGHHFGAALNWINRYYNSFGESYDGVEADRQLALKRALGEFKFLRGRLTSKDSFYPLLLIKEAIVYELQGDFVNTEKNYRELMKLKPTSPEVYVYYARYMKSLGKESAANEVLILGLKNTNGSEIIKKMMGVE